MRISVPMRGGEVQLEQTVAQNPKDSDPLLENQEISSGTPSDEIKEDDIESGSASCCRICLESDCEPGMYTVF